MRVPTAPLCSSLAIATALLFPAAAGAQAGSFQGTSSVVQGSATVSQQGPIAGIPNSSKTTITVTSAQSVINWTPTGAVSDGVQVFQDSGEALFLNGRGVTDFAVLNRVLPSGSARISMNGIINAQVNGKTGGTVYFYSPNGIVIGSDARIDVGRLGLTTADPWTGSGSSWTSGDKVVFRQALAGSSVQVNAGAQIRALNESSYVAMVAPVIGYAGSTEVNGSAALVAAEAATVTFNPNGLFDIEVTVGSGGAGEKISSGGSITGPASSGAGDHHRITMVAVPKNDAISMALTAGTLGFDVAGRADVVGNAIVLSAGHNISGGHAEAGTAAAAGATASLSIRASEVTSALHASATDSVSLGVVDAAAHYWSDVILTAAELVEVFADDGGALLIDGLLSASADH